jgi:hypothetical protein
MKCNLKRRVWVTKRGLGFEQDRSTEITNQQVQIVEMIKLQSPSSFHLDEDYRMKNMPRGEGFVNHCSAVHDPESICMVATDWSIDLASAYCVQWWLVLHSRRVSHRKRKKDFQNE